jgi:two-component sensor histidine kinase
MTVESIADLELRLETDKADASLVRRFVAGHYECVLHDDDAAYRLGMAAHELIENAAKYATDQRARLRIERRREGDDEESVALSIQNTTAPVHAARLAGTLQEMEACEDAGQYYRTLMRQSAKRRGPAGGLGLARIRAEGQMTITVAREGDEVCVRAELHVGKRGSA